MYLAGAFQPLPDQIDIALRRLRAAFRFLLKNLQPIDRGRIAYGVDRPVRSTCVIFDQFEHARAAKPLEHFCDWRRQADLDGIKRHTKPRRTSLGTVCMSRRLEPIYTTNRGFVSAISNYMNLYIGMQGPMRKSPGGLGPKGGTRSYALSRRNGGLRYRFATLRATLKG